MSTAATLPSTLSEPSCSGDRHLVEFYESDASLAGSVARFLAPALAEAGGAIVVATPAHRAAFEAALTAAGVDVAGAAAAGRFVTFDAAELLASFCVDGAPDRSGFRREVGGLLARMGAGGGRLRIYGEMVALLWEGGNAAAAVALEDLWNEIATDYDFELLCAYRLAAFDNEDDALAFGQVCEQHASRPEQVLLAELAYADALTGMINRRNSGAGRITVREPRNPVVDSLVLTAWRNASQLMASPGGRVLEDIVATEMANDFPG
jgi:hypothetical protein